MAISTSGDRSPASGTEPRRPGVFVRDPDVPAWIHYPVRLVAVVVMVTLVLLWELVRAVGRGVEPYLVRPVVWFLRTVIGRPVGWLVWYLVVVPLRAAAVALRWVWSLRYPLGRFLYRFGVRPVLWLGRYLLVPLRALGRALLWVLSVRYPLGRILYRYGVRPLLWLMRYGIGVPVAFLARYLVVVPLHAMGVVLRWAWYLLARTAAVLLHYAVIVPARVVGAALRWLGRLRYPIGRFLARYVVAPAAAVARMLGRSLTATWQAARWLLAMVGRALWRYAVRPLWIATRTAWRYLVVVPARALVWTWRHTVLAAGRWVRRELLVPTGHWLRDAVYRPTRAVGRGVLLALGLRR